MHLRHFMKFALLAGIAVGSIAAAPAWADARCDQLNEKLSGPDNNFRPPLGATAEPVAPSKRVYLRSAPDEQCVAGQPFIVKGDHVTVYKPYKEWMQVMYVSKSGEDYTGWVKETEIKESGTMGLQ
ncbi:hypothetical protein [Bordetella sp. N]|uniref:hypothetical protein n=1 Tax=Bordetella sp. N TaxID=1746199 RepID=UPI00070E78A1|nr:hypothetical protein [Bordetella sp. N]ALM82801.1 hypothetical protein ASB57_07400 [Bordetella sp. N]